MAFNCPQEKKRKKERPLDGTACLVYHLIPSWLSKLISCSSCMYTKYQNCTELLAGLTMTHALSRFCSLKLNLYSEPLLVHFTLLLTNLSLRSLFRCCLCREVYSLTHTSRFYSLPMDSQLELTEKMGYLLKERNKLGT